MATRVFIPIPASPPVTIDTDPPDLARKYRFIVNMTPDWYLFFSRTIGGNTATDAEILASLETGVYAYAVSAQNAALEAQAAAYFAERPQQDDRPATEARAAVETQSPDRSEIAELRKEVEQLRAIVWSIVQPPPLLDSASARITMRI